MIARIHIQNYKCFPDLTVDLQPFNVLIGPNDSGKTAFLQAINVIDRIASQGIGHWGGDTFGTKQQISWRNDPSSTVVIEGSYGNRPEGVTSVVSVGSDTGNEDPQVYCDIIVSGEQVSPASDRLRFCSIYEEYFGSQAMFLLSPSDLRSSSRLSERMGPTGKGLASFLDEMLREDRKAFIEMEREFYKRSGYSNLRISSDGGELSLVFQTNHGEQLQSQLVSDGVMLTLAYLAICYQPNPPKILLLEEPEKGVHHGSLEKTVTTLRSLCEDKGVQIILTTHSPYLLDLVEPEEVLAFRKGDDGAVKAKRMTAYKDVQKLQKHFKPGEIWAMLSEKEGI
ncbi:MAG: AAA family ATPase [Phycisphaerae bacterium]